MQIWMNRKLNMAERDDPWREAGDGDATVRDHKNWAMAEHHPA